MADNLAAVVTKYGEPTELMEIPFRKMEPGSVIVQVDAATLCGTDAGRWSGKFKQGGDDQPFVKSVELPFVPGHELCGTIVEIADEARDIFNEPLKIGDRIITSYGHCGECYYCRVSRQTTLCHDLKAFGYSSPEMMVGACAKYQYFPPSGSYIRVPEGLSPAVVASGTCALRTVMHGLEHLGRIASHESVLVLGAGPLGLYAIATAREHGAREVNVIGAPAQRLEVAKKWGANEVLNLEDEPDVGKRIQWARDLTGGRGADIVFNCASGYAVVEAMRMARPGGRLVEIAQSAGPDIQFPPLLLFRGVHLHLPISGEARHFYQAMEFLSAKRNDYPFADMISNSYSLEETGAALRGMAELTEVKPVIYPNGAPATS